LGKQRKITRSGEKWQKMKTNKEKQMQTTAENSVAACYLRCKLHSKLSWRTQIENGNKGG